MICFCFDTDLFANPLLIDLWTAGEQLNFMMDTVASGHTFMDTEQTYLATRLVIESLTLEVR